MAIPDLVARAVDQFYRSLLIAETNRGYAELRANGEELDELEVLDGSLADGLTVAEPGRDLARGFRTGSWP